MSLHEQRVAKLVQDNYLRKSLTLVGEWIGQRPTLKSADAKWEPMFLNNIPGEIHEARAEAEASHYDAHAHHTEMADVLYFIWAVVSSRDDISVDLRNVTSRVDGEGPRSNIYEKMAEVSGNTLHSKVSKEVEYLLQLYLSCVASLPHEFDLRKFLHVALRKNSKNYPVECFTDKHPYTHQNLLPEELDMSYVHATRSLRAIRTFHRNIMKRNVSYGIQGQDYKQYLFLIRDFPNSEHALQELKLRLYADNHLPIPQNPVL